MELKEQKKIMLEAGVKFLPWVGENYQSGLSYSKEGKLVFGTSENSGKKILVLGESHYCENEADAKDDLTQKIIEDYIDPDGIHEPYKNTYTKFSRAMTGKLQEDKSRLWNSIAFYNYIQEAMSNPRESPSNNSYSESSKAFFTILDILQPDYVIAWGIRLYNYLPPKGKQGKDIDVDDDYSLETWVYTNSSDKEIPVLGIYHPSSGFAWSYWHNAIVNFIRDYHEKTR